MEWISVNDKLPPDSSDINEQNGEYYLIRTTKYGWLSAMFEDGRWYASYTAEIVATVTHWMKIEDVPQEVVDPNQLEINFDENNS